MRHIPRKRFGQHFLADAAVVEAIVRAIAPQPRDRMVEIGPGLGALTLPLLEHLPRLTVIELDRDLAARLRQDPRLAVVQEDVLRVDFERLAAADATALSAQAAAFVPASMSTAMPAPAPASASAPVSASAPLMRIVGNLPYNISTPILFHLLPSAARIADQHFMLQKEVVDRMVAQPATAAYGRLSVMLQWRYAMEPVLDVPPEAFEPPPRVRSAVVRMVPLPLPLASEAVDAALLSELVQVAFSQRRKLLRHTLGRWLEEQAASSGGDSGSPGSAAAVAFDVQRRAEEVPVAQYVALAQALAKSL